MELTVEKIKEQLNTLVIGSDIIVLEQVDSTNNSIKQCFKKGHPEGLVVIADSQTGGKGRLGRSWFSKPGVGIYLSILLTPDLEPFHFPHLTLMASVAAVRAVNEISSVPASLKWPNDLLIDQKKVCGILAELCEFNHQRGAIIGIGINVNQDAVDFPDEFRESATSLKIQNGAPMDRVRLVGSLLSHLDHEYNEFLLGGEPQLVRKWSEHTRMFGHRVSLRRKNDVFEGIAKGLDDEGNLIVMLDDGNEMAFNSGEVTLSF